MVLTFILICAVVHLAGFNSNRGFSLSFVSVSRRTAAALAKAYLDNYPELDLQIIIRKRSNRYQTSIDSYDGGA